MGHAENVGRVVRPDQHPINQEHQANDIPQDVDWSLINDKRGSK